MKTATVLKHGLYNEKWLNNNHQISCLQMYVAWLHSTIERNVFSFFLWSCGYEMHRFASWRNGWQFYFFCRLTIATRQYFTKQLSFSIQLIVFSVQAKKKYSKLLSRRGGRGGGKGKSQMVRKKESKKIPRWKFTKKLTIIKLSSSSKYICERWFESFFC